MIEVLTGPQPQLNTATLRRKPYGAVISVVSDYRPQGSIWAQTFTRSAASKDLWHRGVIFIGGHFNASQDSCGTKFLASILRSESVVSVTVITPERTK